MRREKKKIVNLIEVGNQKKDQEEIENITSKVKKNKN